MTASPAPEILTIPGPRALPAVVPHLVGFVPAASLVVVGLDDRRVRLTVRLDLPPLDEPVDRYLDELQGSLSALTRAGAASALAVVYPPDDESPWRGATAADLPRRALVTELEAALDGIGVHLLDALCVVGDRMRSYVCDDPGCCPPEGRLADPSESLRIQAAMVLSGSAPRASRGELEASLEPRDESDPVVLAVEQTRAALGDCERHLSVGDVESFGRGITAWTESDDDSLLAPLVGLVTALCQRIRPRDLLLVALASERDRDRLERIRTVLVEAVRCAVPAETAPVAALLAVVSWLLGDGATARVALDRAFACDPGYSLAALVSAALDHGLHPEEWAEGMRGISVEDVLRATAPDYPPGFDEYDDVDDLLDAYDELDAAHEVGIALGDDLEADLDEEDGAGEAGSSAAGP